MRYENKKYETSLNIIIISTTTDKYLLQYKQLIYYFYHLLVPLWSLSVPQISEFISEGLYDSFFFNIIKNMSLTFLSLHTMIFIL